MSKLITTDKEIIKKIAKKYGYSEITIKRVLNLMVEFLGKETDRSEVYAITIPYIGILSFNTPMFLADKHRKENNKGVPFSETKYIKYKEAEKKYNAISEKYKKYLDENEKDVFVKFPLHFKRKGINNYGQVGTNFRYQIEAHQNGWANNDPDYKSYIEPEPIWKNKTKQKQ